MRIGNFNVAGIARSNFEPGRNVNGRRSIRDVNPTINVASVGASVNESVVTLRDGGARISKHTTAMHAKAAGLEAGALDFEVEVEDI